VNNICKDYLKPHPPERGGVCQGTRRLSKEHRACIWYPPAEICCSPIPRYELVQRSHVGGDELLYVLTQHDCWEWAKVSCSSERTSCTIWERGSSYTA
jgi:hypothetical protein